MLTTLVICIHGADMRLSEYDEVLLFAINRIELLCHFLVEL